MALIPITTCDVRNVVNVVNVVNTVNVVNIVYGTPRWITKWERLPVVLS